MAPSVTAPPLALAGGSRGAEKHEQKRKLPELQQSPGSHRPPQPVQPPRAIRAGKTACSKAIAPTELQLYTVQP